MITFIQDKFNECQHNADLITQQFPNIRTLSFRIDNVPSNLIDGPVVETWAELSDNKDSWLRSIDLTCERLMHLKMGSSGSATFSVSYFTEPKCI